MEYQELIKVIRDELESSKLIARVENDDIPSIDLKKRSLYPLVAFYIDSVEITNSVNTFTVQLLIADILDVNKQTNQDNQDFIWNQSIAVINNLYNKLNRGQLFEDLVQEIEPINLTPFTDRLDKGLAGMETTLTISVKNDMTLCVFPFKYAANGVTVVLKSGYAAGTTGKVQGDNSGKIYTAVNETKLRAMDVDTDDFTSVCTTLVTDMSFIFSSATSFNQPINNWDVSNVNNMIYMFSSATSFDQPLDNWNVSNVTNMGYIFANATAFNQPLNDWDVSSFSQMNGIFASATAFNQPLNDWDVSNVTHMVALFANATAFNQPLNDWDVSNFTVMGSMFKDASSFNQDLSSWCVTDIPTKPTQFDTGATAWILANSRPIWGTCP